MTGVIILAHGSRRRETEQTLVQIANYVREEVHIDNIEIAFMEFSDVNLTKALEDMHKKGIDQIVVVPYFLFEGIHIKQDIPEEIEAFTKKHPEVSVKMGSTLGADRRIAMVLADRVKEMVV